MKMRIDNNLGAMTSSALQLQQSASNISEIASAVTDLALQEVSADLISEVAGQIPEIISYSANAKSIEVQSAVMDRLLDLKA
jgi:flagellar hook protein FlgE